MSCSEFTHFLSLAISNILEYHQLIFLTANLTRFSVGITPLVKIRAITTYNVHKAYALSDDAEKETYKEDEKNKD